MLSGRFAGAVPVKSLWRSGPPRPGTGSAGHGESDASLDEGDHLLPKLDQAGSVPGDVGTRAGHCRMVLSVVVRCGPVRTAVNGTLGPMPLRYGSGGGRARRMATAWAGGLVGWGQW